MSTPIVVEIFVGTEGTTLDPLGDIMQCELFTLNCVSKTQRFFFFCVSKYTQAQMLQTDGLKLCSRVLSVSGAGSRHTSVLG